MTRKALSKEVKIATLLLHIERLERKIDPTLKECIEREKAKAMSAREIIKAHGVEYDHFPIAKWLDGPDHPTNLVPKRKAEHLEKTRRIDTPQAAKSKRILKERKFVVTKKYLVLDTPDRNFVFTVPALKPKAKYKWPSRPMRSSGKFATRKASSGKGTGR